MLLLIRGLPGSGKSSLGLMLGNAIAADDFFMEGSNYKFDPSRLAEAHADCQARCKALLSRPHDNVVVANTFSARWELEPYLAMAREFEERVIVIDLFDGGLSDGELAARNSHGVPADGVERMRARWEHDWRSGNPLPPWGRG